MKSKLARPADDQIPLQFAENRTDLAFSPELTTIHLQELIEAWADHWCTENNVKLIFVAYNGYDKIPNPNKGILPTKKEIQGSAGKKLEKYVAKNPDDPRFRGQIPQITLLEAPLTASTEGVTTPLNEYDTNTVVFTPDKITTLTKDKKLVKFNDKYKYKFEYETKTETRTDVELRCSLKIGGTVQGVGIEGTLETALKKGITQSDVKRVSTEVEIDLPHDPSDLRVLSLKTTIRTFTVNCVLQGAVVMQVYNKSRKETITLVTPVSDIFFDLTRYDQESSLNAHLKSSLACFKFSDQKREPYTTINTIVRSIGSHRLSTVKDKSVVAQFQESLNNYNTKYRTACTSITTIDRQFFGPIEIRDNYFPLSMVRPNTDPPNKMIDFNEFISLLHNDKRLYLTAPPGMGKSTFVTWLLNLWASSSNTELNKFQWVFKISLGQLEKYIEKNKNSPDKLVLQEVIKALAIPESMSINTQQIFDAFYSLWYDELDAITSNDKSKSFVKDKVNTHSTTTLLILDGWDELAKHFSSDPSDIAGLVNNILQRLCQCPYIIITSRSYFVNDLSRFGLNNLTPVRITGFDLNIIPMYVRNYFQKLPSRYVDKNKSVIPTSVLKKFDDNISRTPLLLELICLTWYLWGDRFQQLHDHSNITACLYENILLYYCLRYIHKFGREPYSENDLDDEDFVLAYCKDDLAIMEHFAFYLFFTNCSTYVLIESKKYLSSIKSHPAGQIKPSQNDVGRLRKLGIVQPEGEGIHIEQTSRETHKFTHSAFVEYFSARFLVSCLRKFVQEKLKLSYPSSPNDLLQHDWSKLNSGMSLLEFLNSKTQNPTGQRVLKLMREIVESIPKSLTNSNEIGQCLNLIPVINNADLVEQLIDLRNLQNAITSYHRSGCQFIFKRADQQTLVICCKTTLKTHDTIRMLTQLETGLRRDLENDTYSNIKIQLSTKDDVDYLTITCDSVSTMDLVCSSLLKPFKSDQSSKHTQFFKWPIYKDAIQPKEQTHTSASSNQSECTEVCILQ